MTFWKRRVSPKVLTTARIRIVPGSRLLVDDFVAICDDQTMSDVGWTPQDVIDMCVQIESGSGPARLVIDRETGRAVGFVVATRVGDGSTILGWIGTTYRRQGYGSDVLEFLCAEAFVSGCRSVLIAVPTANPDLVPFVENRKFVVTGSHQLLNHHNALIPTLLYRRMAESV